MLERKMKVRVFIDTIFKEFPKEWGEIELVLPEKTVLLYRFSFGKGKVITKGVYDLIKNEPVLKYLHDEHKFQIWVVN